MSESERKLNPIVNWGFELIWLLSSALIFKNLRRRFQIKFLQSFVKNLKIDLEGIDFLLRNIDVDWYSRTNGINKNLPACLLHFLWIGRPLGLSPCPELTVKLTKYLSWFGVQVLHGAGIQSSFGNEGEIAVLADPNHQRRSNIHDLPKTCIVTNIFGSIDEVLPFNFDLSNDSGAFVICDLHDRRPFTGRSKVHFPECNTGSQRHRSRKAKLLAAKHFASLGYSFMLYHDANVVFKQHPEVLIQAEIKNSFDISFVKHPFRSSIADEAVACCSSGKASLEQVQKQVQKYLNTPDFRDDIMIESNVFLVDLRSSAVLSFFERWHSEFEEFATNGQLRDQLSLPYILKTSSELRWRFFDFGNVRNSRFFLYRSH